MQIRFFLAGILFFVFTLFSPLNFAAEKATSDDLAYFLTLADIHFDPFYSCKNTVPCPVITKLRHAPVSEWGNLFATYDVTKPEYKQDSNYPLLQSMLQSSKKIAETKQVQFILVLGDFLSHNYRDFYKKYANDPTMDGYQDFVRKTFSFLTEELAKTFPKKEIYAVVGNNDSYEDDYVTNPNGQFFRDGGVFFGSLIKDEHNRKAMEKTFRESGYYAITIQPKLRLIVLNTNLFSAKAKGRNIDKTAEEQLDWLHQELAAVKENHQKVIIAMHIPMGIDVYSSLKIKLFSLIEFWQAKYKQRFTADLQAFAPQVIGLFAGHLHADWFQILKPDEINTIPVIGTPAISPIFGNNPGFKLFTYSKKSEQLENFITYYYPLLMQSAWDVEYDFRMIYKPNCHECPIATGMNLLERKGSLADYYKRFYAVNTDGDPISSDWDPYYWCAIHEVDAERYGACIGKNGLVG